MAGTIPESVYIMFQMTFAIFTYGILLPISLPLRTLC